MSAICWLQQSFWEMGFQEGYLSAAQHDKERENVVWGSASGKCSLLEQISLGSRHLLFADSMRCESVYMQCPGGLYLTETKRFRSINFDFLMQIQKLTVHFLWGGCVHVQFATRTSIELIALNFCYDSWRMSVCLTSASLSQVSSWSLFYPKLLHSQQALHLNTEGVCKDPASQHFSFPFSYILCSWLAFRVSSLLFMNGFNWGFLQLWALLDS